MQSRLIRFMRFVVVIFWFFFNLALNFNSHIKILVSRPYSNPIKSESSGVWLSKWTAQWIQSGCVGWSGGGENENIKLVFWSVIWVASGCDSLKNGVKGVNCIQFCINRHGYLLSPYKWKNSFLTQYLIR